MRSNLAILALLLAVAGCKIEQPASRSDLPDDSLGPVSVILYAEPGEDVGPRTQEILDRYPGRQVTIRVVVRERQVPAAIDTLRAGSAPKEPK